MGMWGSSIALLLAILLMMPASVSAQSPREDWRTLEIPGYRVHYPAEYEAWVLRTARVLESIRARLVEEIAYDPALTVDVLVMDPSAQANGFVLPLRGAPRMVLWTSPPPADSIIGNFRSWPELLLIHEDAHLVHLLRPSRNPLLRLLEKTVLPVGPVVRHAPRWVSEGYATVLEGQLTGAGRPHADLRAAILRRWAQRGGLPSYGRLAADEERWQGMSMAYLAGSAYLEWLIDRRGPDSLRDLWARLTARTVRSFGDAFTGVYGEEPDTLYGRFTAELTERAMIAERALEPYVRQGDLWQRIEWSTGVPAVSSDGSRLAIVVRRRERPARLVVWSTAEDAARQREREWQERISRMLERDPEDVAPVRDRPLPLKPLHELQAIDGADPESPRWMTDGGSILFTRFDADADGFLHPDLYRWYLDDGRVARITTLADVRDADPAPDGTWAVAVRHRHGLSQLVRVDLENGRVSPWTEASVDIIPATPRLSPDGSRLVYLRHTGDGWRAVIRHVDSGVEHVLHTPPRATLTHPGWSDDGETVFLSLGEHGFIDIHALAADGTSPPQAVTRTHGAALGAAPAPGGLLYFLSLEPHGLDLRVIRHAPAPPLPAAATHPALVPAVVPPVAVPPSPPMRRTVPPGRGYGIGRQEFMPILGGLRAPSGRQVEVGVRGGDVVGRLNYFAVGSIGGATGTAEGAALAAAWRGWALTPRAHVFSLDERPSAQPIRVPGLDAALDARRRGVEIGAGWERQRGRRTSMAASVSGLLAELEPGEAAAVTQRVMSAHATYEATPSYGLWHWRYAALARVDGGRTDQQDWRRLRTQAQVGIGYDRRAIRGTWEWRGLGGTPSPFDRLQVGGVPGSVLPSGLAAARVHVPALPLATLVGDRYERQRIDVRTGFPFPLFFERHRMRDRGGPRGDWLRLVGTEIDVVTAPVPLARLPAPVFRFGVARILDAPFEGDTRWWFSLGWRP